MRFPVLAALEDVVALVSLAIAGVYAWQGVWPGFVIMGVIACIAHWAARILREP